MDDPRSQTGSIETDASRDAILAFLEDGRRAPEWAPAFADEAVPDGDRWRGSKDGREFGFRVAVDRAAGTADYLLEVAPGEENGAYIRVVPRIGGGSVVSITVPVRPGASVDAVRATITAELAAIVELASGG
jgi:hypothetical protein